MPNETVSVRKEISLETANTMLAGLGIRLAKDGSNILYSWRARLGEWLLWWTYSGEYSPLPQSKIWWFKNAKGESQQCGQDGALVGSLGSDIYITIRTVSGRTGVFLEAELYSKGEGG